MKRSLRINTKKLWVVAPASKVESVDENGDYTGEFTSVFGVPVEVRLTLYPSNGLISEQIFGKSAELDLIAVSGKVKLEKNSLLFLENPVPEEEEEPEEPEIPEEPEEDPIIPVKIEKTYFNTYDYKVKIIKSSLNIHHYGLVGRI